MALSLCHSPRLLRPAWPLAIFNDGCSQSWWSRLLPEDRHCPHSPTPSCTSPCIMTLFCFWDFALARQALYCLSHASSPFCPGYFGDGGLAFLALDGLDCDSTICTLPSITGMTGPPSYLLRWGFPSFLPGLASNHNPPDLRFPSSWDYRRDPLAPKHSHFLRKKWKESQQEKSPRRATQAQMWSAEPEP
jgi:hypothetical protein